MEEEETEQGEALMQLRQVEYVLEIAKRKTMRAAASHLFVSQSTISQQLHELERELGIELFERTGRCLWLTDECRKLLPRFQAMIDAREAILREAYTLKARLERNAG